LARKREGSTNRRALVASGRQVDLGDESEAQKKKRQTQKWQSDAWRFYHEIGEIAYAYDFIAAALRRARLVIAKPDAESGAPTVLDPSEAPEAWDALDRVKASSGGQGAILANLSICLGVPGEGYVVGWHPDGPNGDEEWDAFSPDQLHGEGTDWYIATAPNQSVTAMTKLTDQDFVCRIWKRDPQWRDLAMSAMRPLITSCDELLILSRAIRAAAVSRLAGAGVLIVPDEISFGSADPTEDDGDPLTDDLLAVMTTPIEDPTSAAAVVPFILRVPSQLAGPDMIRHLTFDRPIDPEQAKQRTELLHRIFNGLDMPTEQFEGNSNHWNAWLADDQGQDRLESLLTLICAGLTSGYLRPALGENAGDLMVWFDPSEMVKHPNLSTDAEEALANAAIGYPAYRRVRGFDESDAMEPDDFEYWKEVQAAKHAAKPAPVDSSNVVKGAPAQPETDPALDDTPIVASARDRLPIGSELLDLERGVRHRLQVAADAEMTRTLERVGAKLRRKAGQRGAVADLVRGVDNALVAQAVGPKLIEQWGFTNDQLLDGSFLALYPKWEGWTSQAQRRIVTIANREGADLSPDEYVAQNEQARVEGWQILLSGLTSLAALRLYDPNPVAPPLGEVDLLSTVPVGIIRGALSRAGGSNGQLTDSGAMLTEDSMGRQIATGGLTTGPDAMQALAEAGLTPSGFMWSTGGPDRPFEPHDALDGQDFTDWNDEALAADPGEFPFVSVYAPGDHAGCCCDISPVLDAAEVDVPDSAEAA
jgi:hypothetical protein